MENTGTCVIATDDLEVLHVLSVDWAGNFRDHRIQTEWVQHQNERKVGLARAMRFFSVGCVLMVGFVLIAVSAGAGGTGEVDASVERQFFTRNNSVTFEWGNYAEVSIDRFGLIFYGGTAGLGMLLLLSTFCCSFEGLCGDVIWTLAIQMAPLSSLLGHDAIQFLYRPEADSGTPWLLNADCAWMYVVFIITAPIVTTTSCGMGMRTTYLNTVLFITIYCSYNLYASPSTFLPYQPFCPFNFPLLGFVSNWLAWQIIHKVLGTSLLRARFGLEEHVSGVILVREEGDSGAHLWECLLAHKIHVLPHRNRQFLL